MIVLDNVSLQRGGRYLFRDSSLVVHRGQHVGVTGANGSGKTSLFQLLLNGISPDGGAVRMPKDIAVSHMAQEVQYSDRAAVDYVIDGDRRLRRAEQELHRAEQAKDEHMIAKQHDILEHIDGYHARHRAEQILLGLGFSREDVTKSVQTFSGGWRIRLNLAQVLMSPGDLMLLDEPTNHLDLDATIWLERRLDRYPGTLLLISHDQDFLDAVAGHIIHIENTAMELFHGNYSSVERQRAQRRMQQQALYEKQQARIREINRFVNRFRAKATKAKQAQSRLKELARMKRVAAAHADSPFHFRIPRSPKMPDPLLNFAGAAVGFDDRIVLHGLDFSLHPGTRVGLLGRNGAGKSTLIRTIAGHIPLRAGARTEGEHLRVAYFAQHQLEVLDQEASPFLHLRRLSPEAPEQVLRDYLGGFYFRGDRALESINNFSGGEKARLALAILAWQAPNLLLLDEPTNHLDMEMRYALTLSLQEYEGAMIIVSHDRHLLRHCVDEFWLVTDGRVESYDGDLGDYQQRLADADREAAIPGRNSAGRPDARGERQRAAARRAAAAPLKKKLASLEKQVDRLHASLAAIEKKLSGTEIYRDENRRDLQDLLKQQGGLKQHLFALEEEWLSCQEAMDALDEQDEIMMKTERG